MFASYTLYKHGILEAICGPMFSGKSEELMRRLRRAKIAKQCIAVFRPALDTRYNKEQVVSHDGNTLNALAIEKPATITEYVQKHSIAVIGIDEVQFFEQDIISVICELVNDKKRVVIAGLDLDFRGLPFGPMPTLLAIADTVTKLQAICTICGSDAHFSQRLIDNKPARFDDPIILVGAQEKYDARCRTCFSINKMPSF